MDLRRRHTQPVPGDATASPHAVDLRWSVRVRPWARESAITHSPNFMSWSDELTGVQFICPRCGRDTAVLRRLRPVGCHPIYWLLCLSTIDRGATAMSTEVTREVLVHAVGADDASRVLGELVPPGR